MIIWPWACSVYMFMPTIKPCASIPRTLIATIEILIKAAHDTFPRSSLPLPLYVSMYLCLSVSLPLSLSLCVSICLSIFLSVCLYVSHLPFFAFIHTHARLLSLSLSSSSFSFSLPFFPYISFPFLLSLLPSPTLFFIKAYFSLGNFPCFDLSFFQFTPILPVVTSGRVFGAPLETVAARDGWAVADKLALPLVIRSCIEYIETHGGTMRRTVAGEGWKYEKEVKCAKWEQKKNGHDEER